MFIKEIRVGKEKRKGGLYYCDKCEQKYNRTYKSLKKMELNSCYDKDYCNKCWRKILNNRPEYKQSMSLAINNMYKKNPEILDKKSKSMIGKNLGYKNAAKRPEIRKKMSESRIKNVTSDPEYRKQASMKTAQAWKDGKFDGVRVGQCKWHKYAHSNGNEYKVQGTWELAFIKWLDENKMKFTCHKGRIPYILDGNSKNYYPDFWVEEFDAYVDVKCKHFYNEKKFKAIKEQNPDKQFKILFKKDLIDLGVDL